MMLTTPDDVERASGIRLMVLPLESINGVDASERANRLRKMPNRSFIVGKVDKIVETVDR